MDPNSQLLTPEKFAWIMDVGKRKVDAWLGGKKRKPQVTYFKDGGVRRISAESALQFILDHTIQASTYRVAGVVPRLADEDVEKLWVRIERLIQIQLAAKERREHKEAA